jgi:D-alanyl-D-alanine carboxypeptidase
MAIRPSLLGILGTTAVLSVLTIQSPAYAQSGGREAQIVVDAETNEVLYENNARELRRPASITKVMTLYLLFDALEKGRISWDDRIGFSRNAAGQPPTKLFVGAGNSISVQTAIEALVLRSANDVATAVAERLGGSEGNFAQMMTAKARELGMSSTTFRNASGLPDAGQRTTAEDLARLAIAIHRDFPNQYHWFSAQQMTYNGQTITGHNHLMGRMQGMDGLKTGYTRASGFNLAATTTRNGRRVVTVVLGGANRFQRDDLVEALTESAYRELGVAPTQFAMNPSGYQVNFRDARDAADAAALIMDLPPRPVTTGGVTTIAMNRSGRRLGFERGPPAFQVADMTRPSPRWPSSFPTPATTQRDDEDGATDEGEEEGGGRVAPPAATPVPVPFRVAVAPSATPSRTPPVRTAQNTPTRFPVVFPNATPTPVPVPVPVPVSVPVVLPLTGATPTPVPVIVPPPSPPSVPLRQMAEVQAPTVTNQPAAPIVVLPPNPETAPATDPRPPVVVFPAQGTTGLRGTTEAPVAPARTEVAEAAPTQSSPPPAPIPTQMAELVTPAAQTPIVEAPAQPVVSEAMPTSNAPAEAPAVFPVQMAEVETAPAPAATRETTPQEAPLATAPTTQVAEVTGGEPLPEAMPTQMAELARQDAATLAGTSASEATSGQTASSSDLNGRINLADNSTAAGGLVTAPSAEEAQAAAVGERPVESAAEAAARQAAEAVALNQRRQAEANAREQARLEAAAAVEQAAEARRREAARVALAARQLAERQAAERRAAERQLAEARAKEQREKAARELALAEREAARERALAVQAEERRQAEAARARNARGTAVVQVGAFKERADATAAIARFSRFFPAFANGEVSTIQRRDGTWYRARFGGLGAIAAREACNLVAGRGGVCAIVAGD